jgi:hypothetical protein
VSATRPGDASRVQRALDNTRQALDELRTAIGVWADSVAQDAEARQGVTAGAADPSKDAGFRLALDALGALDPIGPALAGAEAHFTEAEASITPEPEAEPELGGH